MNRDLRRQFVLIVLLGGLVIILSSVFIGLAIAKFQSSTNAWEEYNRRAEAISIVMVDINRHLGYGGFIHNFKNLVLRRDLALYQTAIERNIADLTADLDQLEGLLRSPENKAAAAQLRATVTEYADKYHLIASMVSTGKSSAEIDAVIKVDDTRALAAMNHLITRITERAREAESSARISQGEAVQFLAVGGLLMLVAITAAALTMIVYLRRINHLMAKQAQQENALRDREHFLRTITDAMPGMVAYWDRDMRCRFANQAYLEWFGKPPQELLGTTMRELLGETLFALNEPFIQGGLNGEAQHFERVLTKADGSIGHTWAHYIPDIRPGGEVAGIFVLVTDVTTLKQAELALAERNAALGQEIHARTQIEQALRDSEKRLQEMSIRDPLTGLYNRRYLDDALPRELARARREAVPVAVIMLDLDHFKQVNDSYGHPAGDEVLKKLADTLRNGARETDMICRYGGEEFVVAMPGMSVAQALQRMEWWRTGFADTPLTYQGAAISVTLSAGIAAFPENGADIDTVLSRADEALYRAKNQGRNRVAVYGTECPRDGDA